MTFFRSHTAKELASQTQAAKVAFTSLCTPGKFTKQNELTVYKEKYTPLVKNINNFREKLFTATLVNEYQLDDFCIFLQFHRSTIL
jgi:hypothetical protein